MSNFATVRFDLWCSGKCNVVLDESLFVDARICLHPPNTRENTSTCPRWGMSMYFPPRFPNTLQP